MPGPCPTSSSSATRNAGRRASTGSSSSPLPSARPGPARSCTGSRRPSSSPPPPAPETPRSRPPSSTPRPSTGPSSPTSPPTCRHRRRLAELPQEPRGRPPAARLRPRGADRHPPARARGQGLLAVRPPLVGRPRDPALRGSLRPQRGAPGSRLLRHVRLRGRRLLRRRRGALSRALRARPGPRRALRGDDPRHGPGARARSRISSACPCRRAICRRPMREAARSRRSPPRSSATRG